MRSRRKGPISSTPNPNSFLLTTTAIKRFQDTNGQNCVYPMGGGELPWKQRPCLHFSLPILRPPWSELSVRSSISNSFGRTKRWNLWNFFASRIFFDSPLLLHPRAYLWLSRPPLLISIRGFFLLFAFTQQPFLGHSPSTHPKKIFVLRHGTDNEKCPLYIPFI